MSAYTGFCASILFPLHERLKGHDSVALRRQMEQTQWWPAERLRRLQLDRLKKLLTGAGQRVPYYRELFRSIGFVPQQLASLDDLAGLPFLTKEIIRANTDRLRAENARDLIRFHTGGSSGEPLTFFLGKERVSHDVAAKWRATRWWGVDIGDPEIVVWGSPIELEAQDRLRALRDRLLRTRLLPAFRMSPDNVQRFLEQIRAVRPRMLFGYPSALSRIARHADEQRCRMDDLGIKVAFVTSERLYDEQRRQIERTFGCRVANGYGGRDTGFIAHECPHGGMHLTAEDIVLEIVDNDGNAVPCGSSGEVVVTHLATGDFPFIRYRTDDLAALDDRPCPCGRGLPLLREIQGRSTDFVVAADGSLMHGLALIYVMREIEGIRSFKIVQEDLLHTTVLIVPGEDFRPECAATIVQGFKARLGREVKVTVTAVADIPAERSGKFRYVVSKANEAR